MSHDEHDEIESLVAGYVLLALDPEDREALEAHLATCDRCAQSVAEWQELAGSLPLLVEQREPPQGLEERILSAVRAQGAVRPPPALRSRGWRRRAITRPVAVAATVAVLALAVIGLAIFTFLPQDDTGISQAKLDKSYLGIDIMAQAEQWWHVAGGGEFTGASGALAYSEEHSLACLVVWGLPTDQGHIYRAWSVKQDVPTSIGKMWGMGTGLWIILPGDPSNLDSLEITRERTRDLSSPQGPVVFRVDLGAR